VGCNNSRSDSSNSLFLSLKFLALELGSQNNHVNNKQKRPPQKITDNYFISSVERISNYLLRKREREKWREREKEGESL
jgi:hypothetical protein